MIGRPKRDYPQANIDPDYATSAKGYCHAILYLRDASKIQARCRDIWGSQTPPQRTIQRWIDHKYRKPKEVERECEIKSFQPRVTAEQKLHEAKMREAERDREMQRIVEKWRDGTDNLYVDPVGIPRRVIASIEIARGIPSGSITAPGRTGDIAKARQLVYFLLHKWGMSAPAIGRAINRDHSSVLHGIKRAKQIIETDALAAMLVEVHLKMQEAARLIHFQRSMQVRELLEAA